MFLEALLTLRRHPILYATIFYLKKNEYCGTPGLANNWF